jgi:mono/diheme cytochrome c family protein
VLASREGSEPEDAPHLGGFLAYSPAVMVKVMRIVKRVGVALGAVALVVGAALAWIAVAPIPSYSVQKVEFHVDVTPERVERGRRTVAMLCAGCHLDSATGALTGKRMPDLPAQFGESFSRNITADRETGIGSWTDAELAYLVRTGIARDGRYLPPWMVKMPNVSDQDLEDLIAFLRSDDPLVQARRVQDRDSKPSFFTKLLCRVAFKPFPWRGRIEAPSPTDKVAYGRYLANGRLLCYECHSADFATNDALQPERSKGYFGGGNPMPDLGGKLVYTANLTPDPETGIGRWTEEEFRRAVRDGIRPDNRPLRYPMVPFRPLTDQEVGALYAYLRSVPPIRNTVKQPEAYVVDSDDRGRQVYYAYGCNGCHGDTGHGLYDLRKGPAKYPTDAELIAWIKHPEKVRPGIVMPTWDGVIREDEYAPRARVVRARAPPGADGKGS